MIRLEETTGNAVAAAIADERRRMGAAATGMVLTLLVLASEDTQADAVQAASLAAREHPMRILVFVARTGRERAHLDAEISVGGDQGPGELAVLRMHGTLAQHAGSVAIPLLLPDTPVVAWWPGDAPEDLADDPIGRHAVRRITDAGATIRPVRSLDVRRVGYQPGDTDLAWTRLTPWRALLAAALDQPTGPIASIEVVSEAQNASGPLLASWLHQRLRAPVTMSKGKVPGVSEVRLVSEAGEISLTRSDGTRATLSRTGQSPATVALARRSLAELLAEELRRLDPDETYAEALMGLPSAVSAPRPRTKSTATRTARRPS